MKPDHFLMGKKTAQPHRPAKPQRPTHLSSRHKLQQHNHTLAWLLVPIVATVAIAFCRSPSPPETNETRPHGVRSSSVTMSDGQIFKGKTPLCQDIQTQDDCTALQSIPGRQCRFDETGTRFASGAVGCKSCGDLIRGWAHPTLVQADGSDIGCSYFAKWGPKCFDIGQHTGTGGLSAMQACCACGGGGAGDPPLTCAAAGSSTCLAENGCMLAGGACVESPVSCDGTTTGACTCTQLTLSIAGVPVSFTLIPVTDPASCCLGFCSFLGVKADTAVPYHLSFRRGKYYATRVASFPACLPSSGELSFAGVYDIEEVQAACHAAPSDHSTPPDRSAFRGACRPRPAGRLGQLGAVPDVGEQRAVRVRPRLHARQLQPHLRQGRSGQEAVQRSLPHTSKPHGRAAARSDAPDV